VPAAVSERASPLRTR